MSECSIEQFTWQGESALTVQDQGGAMRARIVLRGATLLSNWRSYREGELLELTDGYRDSAGLLEQSGVRNGVLAPVSDRIADGRYRFAGQEHDLLPGERGERTVYHGLARVLPFRLESVTTAAEGARVAIPTRSGPDASTDIRSPST